MISNKIDLTEYGDFGDRNPRNELFPIDITLARQLCDMEGMSLKDYEKLERYVEIFGKKWHDNRKYEIFDDLYEKRLFQGEYGHICQCCGAEIRRPWSVRYSICEECNSNIEEDNIYLNYGVSQMSSVGLQSKFIPWRRTRIIPDLSRSGLFDLK